MPAFANGAPELADGAEIRSGKRPVAPGDLLICKINPRINRVWWVGPSRGYPQVASTEWLTLRPSGDSRCSLQWLVWYLRSPAFRAWIELNVEGATGSHTRAKSPSILRQTIPLAPSHEQQAIVDAIEAHLSCLDAGVEALNHAKHRLGRMRASILGGLVAHPQGGWRDVRISELGSVVTGSTPSTKQPHYWGPGTPFVTPGDLGVAVSVDRAARELTASGVAAGRLLPAGSVLVCCIGSVGKCGVASVPVTCNQQINAIVPGQGVDPLFLGIAVASPRFQEALYGAASSTTLPIVNKRRFSNLTLPLPSLAEQRRIAAESARLLSVLEHLVAEVNSSLSREQALRQAILAAAFSGHLLCPDSVAAVASEVDA